MDARNITIRPAGHDNTTATTIGNEIALRSVGERSKELIEQLTELWEASVCTTHHFLSKEDISEIRGYVPMALANVRHLVIAENGEHKPVAFMGVEDGMLEMLFVTPSQIGIGIGRRLVHYGITNLGITKVTVNEQNPAAAGFYAHIGFKPHHRTDHDDQGRPFPLIYMEL